MFKVTLTNTDVADVQKTNGSGTSLSIPLAALVLGNGCGQRTRHRPEAARRGRRHTAVRIDTRAVSQQTVIRHYRARTRDEVEQAYRADALKAARSGYIAVEHAWSQDADGLLLAVTYSGPEIAEQQPAGGQSAVQQESPTQAEQVAYPPPQTLPSQPTTPATVLVQRPAYEQVQRITPVQRIPVEELPPPMTIVEPTIVAPEQQPVSIRDLNGMSAPAVVDESFATTQWLPPQQPEPPMQVERYTPPPEMYAPDPQMYVPVDRDDTTQTESMPSSSERLGSAPEAPDDSRG